MVDWDVFADDEPQQQAAATGEKMDLPEGTHDLQIKRVAQQDGDVLLELAHEDRRYWWAKVKAKKGQGWAKDLLRTLADALGYTREEWAEIAWDELVGRRVRGEILHRVDKGGRNWVNVVKFLPAEEAAAVPQKAKPARTPAAKVKAASPSIGSDDIPFVWMVPVLVSLISQQVL